MTSFEVVVGKRASAFLAAVGLVLACARCGGDGFKGVGPAEAGGAGGEGALNGAPGGAPGSDEGGSGAVTPGGGSSGTGGVPQPGGAGEAGQAGEGNVPITGEHHGYVVDSLTLPASNSEATAVAFDIDGIGGVDNKFGTAVASLMQQGFDPASAIDESIQRGEAILLVDLQASALSSAKGAALSTFFGDEPTPAACAAEQCGKHLLGTASFTLAPSPEGAPCAGDVKSGTFTCRGGALPVRLGLPGVTLDFTLQHAQAELTGVTDSGFISGRLGGAISEADMNDGVFPALHAVAAGVVERDCTGGAAPACGCGQTSTGAAYLGLFDEDDDCAISLAEVKDNSLVASLFAPDVSLQGAATPDAVSCAFKITGKRATFELP